MSYPFCEDPLDEINEELDNIEWSIDYDWLENYEDRRTTKDNFIFNTAY